MRVVVVHLYDLVLDLHELLVQVCQPLPILSDLLFPHSLIDRTCNLLDQPELVQVLNNVETLLQDVILLSVVVQLLFLLCDRPLLPIIHNKVNKNCFLDRTTFSSKRTPDPAWKCREGNRKL